MDIKVVKAALAGAVVAIMVGSSGAWGADIAVEPEPFIAPAPAKPVSDWGGYYIGIHAGYGWGNRDGCIDYVDLFANCDPGDVIGSFLFDYDQDGWLAGGQLGYNYMLSPNLLIGAEVDASLADIEGDIDALIGTGNGNYNWTATAKLRAGVANDWALLYVTGGLGLAGFEYQEPGGCGFEQVRSGWLVGGGAEFKLTGRTSLKAEYNYIDFGSEPDNCTSFTFIPGYVETDAQLHLFKLGLNYKLGDDGAGGGVDYASMDDGSYSDWSGFYAGIHSGYAWGNRDGCIDYFDFNSECGSGVILDIPFDYDQEGWLAGAQLGYNYMVGSMLLIGAEVDASLADIEGNPGGLIGGGKGEYDWTASAKLRAGVANDRALLYVTGGLGLAGFEWQESSGCTFEQTRYGWLVGGGAEVKITKRASLKAEYNYVDYGNETDSCTSFGFLPGFVETDAQHHIVKIGLNYKLGN